jgi:AraC-like DNA-binding protein
MAHPRSSEDQAFPHRTAMVRMLRSAALSGYAALSDELGLDAKRLLDAVGVPHEALHAPDLRIPGDRVVRLLGLSAVTTGIEDFGLRLGQTRELSNLGLMSVVAREASSLRAALAVFARYLRLHNELVSLHLERMDDAWLVAPVVAAVGGLPSRQFVDAAVVVMYRGLAELVGREWRPDLVCLAHSPPRDPSSHRRILGSNVQFDAPVTGIVCDKRIMGAGLHRTKTLVSLQATESLEAALLEARTGTAARAREAVTWLLPTGFCSAATVAARLGLDQRTLHRRLAREGTSYSALVDQHRRDLARQQLADDRPLKQVASALGFEAPSVLSRWFRARFGCSPSHWASRCDQE